MGRERPRGNQLALVLGIAGCAIGMLALGVEGQLLYGFYKDALRLSVGTPIRPMGLALCVGTIGVLAFLIGCPLSLAGALLAVRGRFWWSACVGGLGIILCLLPLPVSSEVIHYIASERGLWMEP